MKPVVFDGGAEEERRQVLAVHDAYLDANASFDVDALARIWDDDPTDVFFNLNGHTYVGREHWFRLWDYYRDRLHTGRWEPDDVKVLIRGELAVVTSHRLSPSRWIGSESPPPGFRDRPERRSRATMVLRRRVGDWKIVHVHFSEMSQEPRPGGV
jgi:ketosteroid isomerase-like protein